MADEDQDLGMQMQSQSFEKTVPRCRYFGECGGCSIQHVPYGLQVNNKKEYVLGRLRRQSIEFSCDCGTSFGSEYGYRNRMDMIFCSSGLGLRKKDKFNSIIPIDRCEISNDMLNSIISEINKWFSENSDKIDVYDMRARSGTLKFALIRTPEFSKDSTISFVLNSDSPRLDEQADLIKGFARSSTARNIVIAKVAKGTDAAISSDCYAIKGEVYMNEILSGCDYTFHSQGFFQNNSTVAQKMIDHTKQIFSKYDTSDSILLDLYGGVGTFGVANSGLFGECLVAESFKESIDCAKMNISKNKQNHQNNPGNASAICIDAADARKSDEIKRLLSKGKDLYVLTDPPRSGMNPKTIRFLQETSPRVIVYISCNPDQMSKELRFFRNYEVRSLHVFDMFPQTGHIEAVVELFKLRERHDF